MQKEWAVVGEQVVASKYISIFESRVNELLNNGWTIDPDSVKIVTSSQPGDLSWAFFCIMYKLESEWTARVEGLDD